MVYVSLHRGEALVTGHCRTAVSYLVGMAAYRALINKQYSCNVRAVNSDHHTKEAVSLFSILFFLFLDTLQNASFFLNRLFCSSVYTKQVKRKFFLVRSFVCSLSV